MEKKSKVKELNPLGGATCVVLENGENYTVRTDKIKRLDITQGVELIIRETRKDIFLYFGQEILGCYEPHA
jgi:hypothetical protein